MHRTPCHWSDRLRQDEERAAELAATLRCPECARIALRRLGATGWGEVGQLRYPDGTPVLHPPTELVLLGRHDPEGRRLPDVVIEQPNPEAGKPVMFERDYMHHDLDGKAADLHPAHRPEGLPDGFLLVGLKQQILPWLDHLESEPKYPGQPVKHLLFVGAHGPEWKWLRNLAAVAEPFLLAGAERRYNRRWKDVRHKVAREIIAAILGEDPGTIRRRIQNHEAKMRKQSQRQSR